MKRIDYEKNYWNKAAKDREVDRKYICDIEHPFFEGFKKLDGKVLEIGCGVGRLVGKGFYGVDTSEEMIKIAKKRKPDCKFKVGDGRTIPYKDKTFDNVYSVLLFQHLPFDAVQFYIDEAARVLKDGGKFIFQIIEGNEDAEMSKHHNISKLEVTRFSKIITKKAIVHPQWTWVFLKK